MVLWSYVANLPSNTTCSWLSSGGSGEGMAVGRQLVPLIPVDVGGEHHPAIDGQFVQDGPCPSPWGCLSR